MLSKYLSNMYIAPQTSSTQNLPVIENIDKVKLPEQPKAKKDWAELYKTTWLFVKALSVVSNISELKSLFPIGDYSDLYCTCYLLLYYKEDKIRPSP